MAENTISFTAADLQNLISTAVATAIEASKKPSELEQRKLDEEAAQLKRKVENRVAQAKAEEQSKAMRRSGCAHGSFTATGAFKHAFRGQVHQDGFIRPVCQQCLAEMPALKATPDMVKDGANLDKYQLNVQVLEGWHKKSVVDCTDSKCYIHKEVMV